MRNIHLLPTDKPSRLVKLKWFGKDKLHLCKVILPIENEEQYQHIYITSDEEIKEGDRDFYILANDRDGTWINRVEKVIECKIDPNHGKVLILSSGFIYIDEGCKIILTTDPDLIEEGVQAIDNEFLEWFVKNPSCERVEVEIIEVEDYVGFAGHTSYPTFHNEYKIILPQEEPKTNLEKLPFPELVKEFVEYYENVPLTEEPKQETLEEAAEKLYPENWESIMEGQHDSNSYERNAFIKGAKWQAERMYSEEEVIEILTQRCKNFGTKNEKFQKLLLKQDLEWFEQHKKK